MLYKSRDGEDISVIDTWLGKEAGIKISRARVKGTEDRARNENHR